MKVALVLVVLAASLVSASEVVSFSCNAVKTALEAIAELDAYPWAEFNFYPCPVGADQPKGCAANPGYGDGPNCCIHDKYEACMVHHLQCFPDGTGNCTMDTRLKMAKFLSCFEGQTIKEDECNSPIAPCIAAADLGDEWPYIQSCFNTPSIMADAAGNMTAACAAENPKWWPYVIVDGTVLCGDDSCMMPLLPPLCKAYKSTPKPRSCQSIGIF